MGIYLLRSIGFAALLFLAGPLGHAATTTLVPAGSTWKYLDTGANLATGWRASGFNDSAWASGPAQLGYGDGDEATLVSYGPNSSSKYITTYFRRSFSIADATRFSSLNLRVLRDDGVVVYLNGTEVYRNNLPSGTIAYSTLASAAVGGADESAFYQASISPALLVDGNNVVAVEIHQNAANSSDISFDLELTGERTLMDIVLNSPAHGATDVGLSPALSVSVSHRENLPMAVTFIGRPAPPVGPDFTLVALPDTQFYSSSLNGGSPAIFQSQADWIVANRASKNIAFVTQLGDCVQNGDTYESEWWNATNALYRLENPVTTLLEFGIPYGVAVGNHDQSPMGSATGTSTYFNKYFGEAHFLGRPYYGGHHGSNNDDHFELFEASGLKFIIVHFEYDSAMTTNSPELAWADQLLQTYSDRQAIVVSHWIMNSGEGGSFSAQGQAIYNRLRTRPNLFMMLCGHVNPNGEGKRTDIFNNQTVYTLLSDYQDRANGGNGWLRTLEFSPANSVIRVRTYSPTLAQFETDANSQFDLFYDMQSLLGNPYTTLGQNSGVASGSATSVPWPSLSVSSEYEWYVLVSDGVETVASPVWRFRTADVTLPLAPSGLTAGASSSSSIVLTWVDNADNESGFQVYQSTDGSSFTPVGDVGANVATATVNGLAAETTYHFQVFAFNGAGSTSSGTTSATTLPLPPPPAAPSNLSVSPVSTSELTLNWTDQSENEEGFRIERSIDGLQFVEINVVAPNVTVFSDSGLEALTLYHYRVRAFNAGGVSAYTEVATGTTQPPPPPAAPTGLTALAGDRKVTLTWDESPGATHYHVYRAEGAEGAFQLREYGIFLPTWVDTVVTPHVTYRYVVRALNAGDSSPDSAEASATPLALSAAPTGAYISFLSHDYLEISWTDNATDETGFTVERSLDNQTFALLASLPPDSTIYGDLDVAESTTYYYRVRAVNADGASAAAEVSGTTSVGPAAAPANLTATAVSSFRIDLAWSDLAHNETGFEIERAVGAGTGNWGALTTVGANTASYSDQSVSDGTTYRYRVRAVNAAGASEYSNEATAVTPLNTTTVTLTSIATQDGYVLESGESTGAGGSATSNTSNSSGLRAGDDNKKKQYRSVVSFDTSALPDGAVIVSATLRLRRGTISGTNPFQTHGSCLVDVKGGSGFNNSLALAKEDFQAAADATAAAVLGNAAANGDWSEGSLNSAGLLVINKTGTTQCRIYFATDDDNDGTTDYIGWYAGDNSTPANRPQLVVVYR